MKNLLKISLLSLVFVVLVPSLSFSQILVGLDFPAAGTYNLQITVSADGKVTIKALPIVKVPSVSVIVPPVPPDPPTPPVVPKSDINKILGLPEFSNLRPFFPAIGEVYALKKPEEVRQAIQDILSSAGDPARISALKDEWAILGGRIADYYDKLIPQPELDVFMAQVGKEFKEFK